LDEFLGDATDEPPSKTTPAVAPYQDRSRLLLLHNRQDPSCGADVGGGDASGNDTGVAELPNDPFLVLLDRIEKRYLSASAMSMNARLTPGSRR
jgi:hypothetical protein